MATLPLETLLNSQLLRNPSPVSAGPRKHTANLVLGSQGLWTKGVVRLNVARSSPGIGCTRRRRCRTWAGVGQLEKKVVLESTGKEKETDSLLRVGIICGGPSAERGISLNSARSVLDHLQRAAEVTCYYLDTNKRPYAISTAQMYSNTPSDFDFKLGSTAQSFETMEAFLEHLRSSVDIVFPVLHGKFGEDGGIQDLLEGAGLPFVGTGSVSAQRAFDKYEASQELCRQGFVTVPSFLVQATGVDVRSLSEWFASNQLDPTTGRVVVKPACAGSSVGVSIAFGVQDATKRAEALLSEGIDDRVIIEVFMEGVEFTAVVLDVGFGTETHPVTLMPTEVELRSDGGSEEASIFDYRKKYLPSRQVSYHTPPRFPRRAVQEIRDGAAKLFQQLGLKDFARFDGWYVPSSSTARAVGQGDPKKKRIGEFEEGFIVFTDINLISGMEQTSFLFQQASQVGLSHADVLRMVLSHACSRFSIRLPRVSEKESSRDPIARVQSPRRKVYVIFGGESSERQVSLISGTNVWLNLCGSPDLDVQPFLLTPSSMRSPSQEMLDTPSNHDVWALPYSLVLRHTVEEVLDCCREALQPDRAATVAELRKEIVSELREWQRDMLWAEGSVKFEGPRQISLLDWIKEAKEENAVVFITVHGGIGENGTLQALLDSQGVLYTGSGAQASRLCANKAATGLALSHLAHLGVLSAAKELSATSELLASLDLHDESRTQVIAMWDDLSRRLQAKTICVKPVGDGCSTGVARLCCAEDLNLYLRAVHEGVPRLLPGTLSEAHGIVEMPVPPPGELLFEEFIETNPIIVASQSMLHGEVAGEGLFWKGLSRWIEVTIGVMGRKNQMRSFNPSITVKESGSILTLEEKFQGGTGVNLTPPPPSLVSKEAIAAAKQRIELVARTLDLEGFARIDAFLHADTGEIIVIEANTIPGMTPSTVLIHQALAEDPPMYPRTFFRAALDLALPS